MILQLTGLIPPPTKWEDDLHVGFPQISVESHSSRHLTLAFSVPVDARSQMVPLCSDLLKRPADMSCARLSSDYDAPSCWR